MPGSKANRAAVTCSLSLPGILPGPALGKGDRPTTLQDPSPGSLAGHLPSSQA